jgi:hypothetical protein
MLVSAIYHIGKHDRILANLGTKSMEEATSLGPSNEVGGSGFRDVEIPAGSKYLASVASPVFALLSSHYSSQDIVSVT